MYFSITYLENVKNMKNNISQNLKKTRVNLKPLINFNDVHDVFVSLKQRKIMCVPPSVMNCYSLMS